MIINLAISKTPDVLDPVTQKLTTLPTFRAESSVEESVFQSESKVVIAAQYGAGAVGVGAVVGGRVGGSVGGRVAGTVGVGSGVRGAGLTHPPPHCILESLYIDSFGIQ